LSAELASLTGYSINDGFRMKLKLTGTFDDPYRFIQQLSMPTNLSVGSWALKDSFFTLQGPNTTDIVLVKRASDDVTLYTFTGSGVQGFDIDSNFGVSCYFVRNTSLSKTLMTTIMEPQALTIGDNGIVNLFYGSEVQLAQSSEVTLIKEKVDSNLDVQVSSRCSQTTGDSIKSNTGLIPGLF